MLKISHVVMSWGLVFIAVAASAAAPMSDVSGAPSSPLQGLSASASFAYIHYSEPGVMNQFGLMPGARVTYFKASDYTSTVYSLEGDLWSGHLTYDGGSISGGQRYQRRAADTLFNFRATIGTLREIQPDWTISPFIGIGYRYLTDKNEGTGSYTRNISYLYVPFGVETAKWFFDKWSVVVTADVDWMLSGVVVSKLSDVSAGNPDLTMHNSGWGFRLATSLRRDLGSLSVHIEPYYQNWTIKQSDVVVVYDTTSGTYSGLVEPANTSNMIGFDVGVDF